MQIHASCGCNLRQRFFQHWTAGRLLIPRGILGLAAVIKGSCRMLAKRPRFPPRLL